MNHAPSPPGQTAPTVPSAPSARRADIPALLAVSLTISCWASAFSGVRYAMQAFSPEHVALVRLMIGSIVLGGYSLAVRMPMPPWWDVPVFLLFGLTGLAVNTLALSYGLEGVSSGAGSFLVGTIPVFSALLSMIFLGEQVGKIGWLGIAVSFRGVALIALAEGKDFRFNPAAWLLVTSAFVQSIFYVFKKPYHHRYSPVQITCYAVWGGTLWLAVFLPGLRNSPWGT